MARLSNKKAAWYLRNYDQRAKTTAAALENATDEAERRSLAHRLDGYLADREKWERYLRYRKACLNCGRSITNPESVERWERNGGYGPECERRVAA